MTTSRPHHLDVGIGGVHVRLRAASPEFNTLMADRFRGFIGNAATPDYVFDVDILPFVYDPDVPDNVSEIDVCVLREGEHWRLLRGDFEARWDPATRHGTARLRANPYALDSVLRILHTVLLAEQGGMLMHASSVVLADGRAFVCTGVSGAGKTTISRLVPPGAHILTDEMSFIRREDDGYYAYGTPFAGELATPGENIRAPLAGVFLLAQGPDNRIDPLSPGEAVRALMANILYFARDDALTAKVFDNAIALAARVPVRRLTFFPDARVWDMIGSEA
ncbi:MAG: hypothetical protein JSR22_00015 [Proteobacteria bacterium]|nr:hypothetical protein [Pseudomonadota bacterium]